MPKLKLAPLTAKMDREASQETAQVAPKQYAWLGCCILPPLPPTSPKETRGKREPNSEISTVMIMNGPHADETVTHNEQISASFSNLSLHATL
jgi:hypothetical protein